MKQIAQQLGNRSVIRVYAEYAVVGSKWPQAEHSFVV